MSQEEKELNFSTKTILLFAFIPIGFSLAAMIFKNPELIQIGGAALISYALIDYRKRVKRYLKKSLDFEMVYKNIESVSGGMLSNLSALKEVINKHEELLSGYDLHKIFDKEAELTIEQQKQILKLLLNSNGVNVSVANLLVPMLDSIVKFQDSNSKAKALEDDAYENLLELEVVAVLTGTVLWAIGHHIYTYIAWTFG